MRSIGLLSLVLTLGAFAGPAQAGLVVVTPSDPQGWQSFGNSGGGSSSIEPSSFGGAFNDGSVKLTGDRTRFGLFPTGGLGRLDNLLAFSFEWVVQQVGGGVGTAQAPALRLHVQDTVNNRFLEIIWEDGEQSTSER
ncbi:hypothetical protein [Tautonia sociabilis]|uniref:PEP-CTERM sorting domain-containing protein n=1 Tax=Tautonia sociabilis TaxID=2080755 RepID=A0A432MMD4_9BACT|nr:hypothetical protein [Tautonia sociabilis]RUL88591.1 hypothetical protein TsocGM_06625 [Tautonia sociabilis]